MCLCTVERKVWLNITRTDVDSDRWHIEEANSTGIMIFPLKKLHEVNNRLTFLSPQVGLAAFMSLCYITVRCKCFFPEGSTREKCEKERKAWCSHHHRCQGLRKPTRLPACWRSERCLWSFSFGVLKHHIRVFRPKNESCFCQKSISLFFSLPALLSLKV